MAVPDSGSRIASKAAATRPTARAMRQTISFGAQSDDLARLVKIGELRDYIWWSGQDAADYADGKLAQALAELRAGELAEEYAPSEEDLRWARRELAGPAGGEQS